MKAAFLFASLFTLVYTDSKAQIAYPTNREIYNFSVGDTFIYNHWHYTGDYCDMTAPNPTYLCSHDYYVVITAKSFSIDSNTVYYTFVNGGYSSYLPFSFPSSYTNLDSPVILTYIDTLTYDTTYIDSNSYCTPRKVASKSTPQGSLSGGGDSTFESGLGLVISFYQGALGDPEYMNYTFKLIYYHKGDIICGHYDATMLVNSINQPESNTNIKLFPNPANNLLEVDGLSKNEAYTIYDATGKVCRSGLFQNQIGIDKLSAGIYFIKVSLDKSVFYQRFIKQ
jgi:hypothetical protein